MEPERKHEDLKGASYAQEHPQVELRGQNIEHAIEDPSLVHNRVLDLLELLWDAATSLGKGPKTSERETLNN